MNKKLYLHFTESCAPGFDPKKDFPFEYCSSGHPQIDGVAIMEPDAYKPQYRRDWQAAIAELRGRYGQNMEKAMVIVENVHFTGTVLSRSGINPPDLIDVRWLGRYAFGNRPYESLSELYTRCGGMPLPSAETVGAESYALSAVRALCYIAGSLFKCLPVQELAVIRQTADIAQAASIRVDVVVLKQLLKPELKVQYPHLFSFVERILSYTDSSGRLHVWLDYSKAVTGRFSVVKYCPIHTIPRLPAATDPAFPMVSAILAAIQAPPGYCFVSADAKAIEPRLFAFLTGEERLYASLTAGTDIYTRLAESVFGNSGIAADKLRQIAKRAFLGFCYGIGAESLYDGLSQEPELQGMVDDGVITRDGCTRLLAHLKSSYPKMVRFGKGLEDDLRYVYKNGTIASEWCKFKYGNNTLSITLPSGRIIQYYGFAIDDNRQMKYTAADGKTKTLYSSKLAQNLVQAVARDLLTNTLHIINGKAVAHHVHDEIVCCVRQEEIDACRQQLQVAWCTPPSWLPEFKLDVEIKTGRNLAELAGKK